MPLPETQSCAISRVKEIRADEDGLYSMIIAVNDSVRYGPDVDLSQLDFTRYLRNPVVMMGHGYEYPLPVGLSRRICNGPAGIEVGFYFAESDEMAGRAENLLQQGILRAASIGWYVESTVPYLAEWSLCAIGLDPEALARTRSIATSIEESSREKFYITPASLKPFREMPEEECTNRSTPEPSTEGQNTEPSTGHPRNRKRDRSRIRTDQHESDIGAVRTESGTCGPSCGCGTDAGGTSETSD